MKRAWNNNVGPVLPHRHAIYDQARAVRAKAELAQESAIAGPRCDVARSLDLLRRLRDELNGFLSPFEGED